MHEQMNVLGHSPFVCLVIDILQYKTTTEILAPISSGSNEQCASHNAATRTRSNRFQGMDPLSASLRGQMHQ